MKILPGKLSIATTTGRYFVAVEEIVRLEASSNYTRIYFTNNTNMLTARVLKSYEKILEPMGFVRTHRSHLVNKRFITFMNWNGQIVLHDASTAGVSRRKRTEVIKALQAA